MTTSLPPGSEEEDVGGAKRLGLLQSMERSWKGTVLGALLMPLVVVLRDERACTLQMANTLQRNFSCLAELTAQVECVCVFVCVHMYMYVCGCYGDSVRV